METTTTTPEHDAALARLLGDPPFTPTTPEEVATAEAFAELAQFRAEMTWNQA